jgi:hypothetical protein
MRRKSHATDLSSEEVVKESARASRSMISKNGNWSTWAYRLNRAQNGTISRSIHCDPAERRTQMLFGTMSAAAQLSDPSLGIWIGQSLSRIRSSGA